jgi:hypothetical protein
MFRIFGR